MEAAWAEIGRLSLTTQSDSAPARLLRLEYAVHRRNLHLRLSLPSQMRRMVLRACKELWAAQAEQQAVYQQAATQELSSEQVCKPARVAAKLKDALNFSALESMPPQASQLAAHPCDRQGIGNMRECAGSARCCCS